MIFIYESWWADSERGVEAIKFGYVLRGVALAEWLIVMLDLRAFLGIGTVSYSGGLVRVLRSGR